MSRGTYLSGDPFYNVPYGLASVAISTTATTIITTTGGEFHGIAFVAGANACTIQVYDNASTLSGSLLGIFYVTATQGILPNQFNPVHFKKGITVSVTGTGGKGTVYYSPKG